MERWSDDIQLPRGAKLIDPDKRRNRGSPLLIEPGEPVTQ